MSWLIDFFESIGTIVLTLISLVISTITSVINLFLMLPKYLSYIVNLFNLLPAFLFPFFIIIPTIIVIWTIKRAM